MRTVLGRPPATGLPARLPLGNGQRARAAEELEPKRRKGEAKSLGPYPSMRETIERQYHTKLPVQDAGTAQPEAYAADLQAFDAWASTARVASDVAGGTWRLV